MSTTSLYHKLEEIMEHHTSLPLIFLFISLLLHLSLLGSAQAYKNYTVGDSLGWYDNTEKSNVNYQKWADANNFSLGDFLIFNTDTNHSVVQTYNFTTYNLCDYDDALDSDTKIWSAADPSNTATVAVTVPVPLLKEGTTYFFSSDYDGDQCNNGQHFKIYVTHGKGLPDSLKSPPSEQAPAPNSPDYNNDESAPDIVVPSNFNNPEDGDHKNDDDDNDNVKKASGSVSLSVNSIMALLGFVLHTFLS